MKATSRFDLTFADISNSKATLSGPKKKRLYGIFIEVNDDLEAYYPVFEITSGLVYEMFTVPQRFKKNRKAPKGEETWVRSNESLEFKSTRSLESVGLSPDEIRSIQEQFTLFALTVIESHFPKFDELEPLHPTKGRLDIFFSENDFKIMGESYESFHFDRKTFFDALDTCKLPGATQSAGSEGVISPPRKKKP